MSVPMARAEDVAPTVTVIETPGGDDVSYHIPLTVLVVYDGTTYQNVYATTNSVITFGRPDGTYWDYPVTPSISIKSKDWWVLPQQMPDTHFILSVSEGGFQVDGSYRPYGTFTGDITNIVITAQIQTDGTIAYTYAVNGPLVGNERTGARLTDGTVVALEEANIIQVEEAPVLEPTPVPPVEPTIPEPTPEPIPEPTPEPTPEPAPQPRPIYFEPPVIELPVEEPPAVEPPVIELPVEELPIEEPPAPVEEPPVEEAPAEEAPTPEKEPVEVTPTPEETIQADEVDLETLAPNTPVQLPNGVILEAGVIVALELFNNPAQLLSEIFTNPAQVLTALSNIGADMSPEVREQSKEVIVSAIIVGQIAQTAALATAGTTAYRRKP